MRTVDVPTLLPVSVAILDRSGVIVGVNEGWKDFGRRSDLRTANFGVGENYLNKTSSLIHKASGAFTGP
jgi:hypothetical protein